MKTLKFMMVLLAMPAILFLGSCTKDNQVNPSSGNSSSNLAQDNVLLPGEFVQGAVSPGTYTITKFIDTGDDQTALFAGYMFDFTADGAFIYRDVALVVNTTAGFRLATFASTQRD